jgi:serine/threonine-protein kinase
LFAVDAAGKTTPLGVSPGNYVGYRFSPDGKLLALVKREGLNVNLWVYDAARGAMPRLTFTTGFDGDPVWAPDGRHLAFASDRDARPGRNIYWVRADGSGEPIRLTASPNRQRPASFSPDGKRLAFTESGQIWTLPLDLSDPDHPHAGKPELFPVTVVVENAPPMFSPDGRWLAYVSNDSGINEVIVRPFPVSSAGGKWQVSTGGGGYPLWTKSGRELFYLSAGGAVQVMQVTYSVKDGAFVPDKPRVWLEKNPSNMSAIPPDLTPDGKRFVVLLPDTPVENKPSTHVTFLLNFFDELRRKAPGRN